MKKLFAILIVSMFATGAMAAAHEKAAKDAPNADAKKADAKKADAKAMAKDDKAPAKK